MITPAFALPNVQENANSDDAYSFDVTIDGLHVTRAVIVENGIPRQLTEAEYVALMQASANEETICSSPASNNSNKVPREKREDGRLLFHQHRTLMPWTIL